MIYLRSGEVMDYLLSLFSVKKLAVPSIWNLQNSSNGLFIDFYQNINSNEGLKLKLFTRICFRTYVFDSNIFLSSINDLIILKEVNLFNRNIVNMI